MVCVTPCSGGGVCQLPVGVGGVVWVVYARQLPVGVASYRVGGVCTCRCSWCVCASYSVCGVCMSVELESAFVRGAL